LLPSSIWGQTATKANSPAREAAETITAEQLNDYLYFVASDEMEGRDTPSRGLDITAKFIALNLKAPNEIGAAIADWLGKLASKVNDEVI
jgi:hypothetical protein